MTPAVSSNMSIHHDYMETVLVINELITNLTGVPMTTDLPVVQQLRNTVDLPERDRGAAEAVSAGLGDAKAGNTRRA